MTKKTEALVTKRTIGINDTFVEAGDLAREIGKFYMQDLEKAVANHRKFKIDKLYFIVRFKKNPENPQEVHIQIGITERRIYKYFHSMDLWEYDYTKDELKLLWTLPHPAEMESFLSDPDKYDKNLIHWIKCYLEQDKKNLKDPNKVEIEIK